MFSPFSRQPTRWRSRRISGRSVSNPGLGGAADIIRARIIELSSVIATGVEGAGYGDKRTDFRSYNELRQILNDLEDELGALEGWGSRPRQIRMITQWDKGL